MIPKTKFNKNLITTLTGSGLAQAFPILISPLLTRLYSPDDFGFFALYLLAVSIMSILATGQFESSIYLPRLRKTVAKIVALSTKLSLIFSAFLFVLIVFLGEIIWDYAEIERPMYWLYLFPVAVYFSAALAIRTQLAIRYSRYLRLSQTRVGQSISNGGIALMLSSFASGFGLILASMMSQIIAVTWLRKDTQINLPANTQSLKSSTVTAKHFRKFPLYMIPSGFLNIVSANMPLIILANTFGVVYVGFYSLVQKTLAAPSAIIGGSFGEVFRQQASDDLQTKGTCRPLLLSTTAKLFILSSPGFLLLAVYTPEIFGWIYGDEWRKAGELAQYLVPMFFVRFVTLPVSSIILLRNKAEIDFWWQVLFLALSAGAYFFKEDVEVMMAYFSTSFSFMYLVSFLINYKYAVK